MRWFGLSLMMVCAVMVGCEQPMTDTVPSAPSASSGTSDEGGEIAAPPAVAPPEVSPPTAEVPAVEAPALEAPAAEAPAAEAPAAEAPAAEAPAAEAPAAEAPKEDTSSSKNGDKVRFVANTSLKVPGMMCPFSCWPKVKETLASQPGVEGVQLAEQVKENEIDNPVVELKVKDGFDSEAAIAALKKVNFDDAVVVK